MCTCITDNEARIAEIYAEKIGVSCDVKAKGVALVFGTKSLNIHPFMPFAVKADAPGFRSAKGKEISMFFSFCPWCGVKLESA